MGNQGEDIKLSPRARELIPYSFECKSRKSIALYKDFDQAKYNARMYEPILVIKQNRSTPLAVVDLDFLLDLIRLSGLKDV